MVRAFPRRCLNCAPLGADLAGHGRDLTWKHCDRNNDRDTLNAVQNKLVSAGVPMSPPRQS
jgi:hypothetical protein